MRHPVNRQRRLNVGIYDDIHIPGIGLGYIADKTLYGNTGRNKLTIYSVLLHEEHRDKVAGGYFIKESWIREDDGGFFVDIDELLLDSLNTIGR